MNICTDFLKLTENDSAEWKGCTYVYDYIMQ